MEKLIYLVWKPQGHSSESFRDHFMTELLQPLGDAGATRLRLNVADSDVDAAKKKRLIAAQLPAPADALVSFWLNSANCRQRAEQILADACQAISGYLVTESEPLVNTLYPTRPSQRTPGMNQVVLLRRPARLTNTEWLDLWLNQHTPIAIATQSTFGYRQNVIVRTLTDSPLTQNLGIDAIVEENFPPEALTSLHAFYKSVNDQGRGDDALLRKNQTTMFTSVQRFIDLDKLDCLPMSEYNF